MPMVTQESPAQWTTSRDADGDAWKRNLSAEQRATVIGWHRTSAWTTGKIPVLFAIWFGCALLAVNVDSLWVRVPCWIVIGFVLHGLAIFMHEGAHRSLFRNLWLDRIVGFLCGLPVAFSCSSYRATHLLHHRYENSPLDPDNLEANFPNPGVRAVAYYAWLLVGIAVYILLVTAMGPFRARRREEKLACVIEPILIVAFYAALFTLASRFEFGEVLMNGWGWALPFALLIANVRGLAEHTQLWHGDPHDRMRATRTLVSNPVVSFFFNNQNDHLEHHLFPAIPWNNLPNVHGLMQPLYAEREASVAKGYLEWFRGVWRFGPNRRVMYRDKRAHQAPQAR
jgi:fatty acid desaturase